METNIKVVINLSKMPRKISNTKAYKFNQMLRDAVGEIITYLEICPFYSLKVNGAYVLPFEEKDKSPCKQAR